MVRAANTGVSCIIDARGRIVSQGVTIPAPGSGEQDPSETCRVGGVLRGSAPLAGGTPLYARVGDGLGLVALLASTILVMVSFVRTRTDRRAVSPTGADGR
jgi:apolipoprotein N-acyltransferase